MGMHKYFRVTVLGNFSGRNAGDNAILGNLLEDISSQYPDVEFIVPTLNSRFVREEFGHYRIKALGMMPDSYVRSLDTTG
jgi:polysaccharide pyruvyl transferase WcaK-like protein